jgi:acetolactate synthase I/II/III large subunit
VTLPIADALVDELERQGFDTVIGVGGTHTMRLLGALERHGKLHFVPARTELGAAHIALGYAKATGRAAAVLTSTGPGCLNITAALQDAQWSSLPMLHITTSVLGSGFAGSVHETPTQRTITDAAGKGTVVLVDDDIVGAVQRSVSLMNRRPRGPVTLDVPAGSWDRLAADEPTTHSPADFVTPDAEGLESLAGVRDALDRAARPLMFVGGGALVAELDAAAVVALADVLQAPIVTSYQGKSVADWNHPLYLGPWASEAAVAELCTEADTALVLGSKLSALGTAYHRLVLPENTWAIGPGVHHPRYPQLQRIDTDAPSAARHLADSITQKASWTNGRVRAIQADVRAEAARLSGTELAYLDAIGDSPEAPSLVSADMCKAGFWLMKHLQVRSSGMHAFSSYMTMGTALPMAIGMTLARGEPSLAVVGDGGFQMSLVELATLVELQAPVIMMVGVDGAYGLLRDNSAAVGGSTDLGLVLWNPDFRQLALAYGISAEVIAQPADLRAALSRPTTGPRMLLVTEPFNRRW